MTLTQTDMTTDLSIGDDAATVCRSDQVPVERAVAVRAPDGVQIALVRTATGELHAVGHHDPYSGANVMARGLIGTVTVEGQVHDVIQSPMYKQAFDLATGASTVGDGANLGVWDVVEADGMIVLRNNRIPARASA
ncbi:MULTISPECIES: nitrite reductase (NAD(P)H) small subunit [Dermacoccus]|uniref:nitrite reductase (NAD(P)H) small subunit n=1 Tax=Dermacoccus TaxID=57495 RepID=UPI00068EA222|nr:nitrite reductase (NAD(P)H) small subunit [Dermacoccus nishinomiyaensis]MCG7428548.1 nitrite reductase (NAD(P)H) small subunit [Dermacoccus nishinomiyaensis]